MLEAPRGKGENNNNNNVKDVIYVEALIIIKVAMIKINGLAGS